MECNQIYSRTAFNHNFELLVLYFPVSAILYFHSTTSWRPHYSYLITSITSNFADYIRIIGQADNQSTHSSHYIQTCKYMYNVILLLIVKGMYCQKNTVY